MSGVRCACGREHPDPSLLPKVGWQDLFEGDGGFALLANCVCRSTIAIQIVRNAALCDVCKRLITGEASVDPKVHEFEGGRARILCAGCARRTGVGLLLVASSFRAWVETGDRSALARWRQASRLAMPARAASEAP